MRNLYRIKYENNSYIDQYILVWIVLSGTMKCFELYNAIHQWNMFLSCSLNFTLASSGMSMSHAPLGMVEFLLAARSQWSNTCASGIITSGYDSLCLLTRLFVLFSAGPLSFCSPPTSAMKLHGRQTGCRRGRWGHGWIVAGSRLCCQHCPPAEPPPDLGAYI